VSEARQLLLQMEHAEQNGDRQSARAFARTILASGERPIGTARPDEASAEAAGTLSEQDRAQSAPSEEVLAQISARELLLRTEPDPFLLVVGVLGLGLLAWLVYNYVL
jgi:hypothetical protein